MAKIGIFDSGYGGLTILDAIRKEIPQYDYLYLGDNARAPYGTHSFEVIYRYTLQAVQYLLEQDCALVILACNTASAKALRSIQQHDLPVINGEGLRVTGDGLRVTGDGLRVTGDGLRVTGDGLRVTGDGLRVTGDGLRKKCNVLGVIRPTVEAVPDITKTGHVGILATPATVSSESYVLELEKIYEGLRVTGDGLRVTGDGLRVTQQACPMWVPLIESGEHRNAGADYFVDLYLREILAKDPQIDTLVLGCTHYPLLLPKIEESLSRQCSYPPRGTITSTNVHRTFDRAEPFTPEGKGGISIISQGSLVAKSLADYLARHPEYREQLSCNGTCTYLTTENADRFSQSASVFLSTPIQAEHVSL